MVWMDKHGDVLTRAYTPTGMSALRSIMSSYQLGQVASLEVYPEDFIREVSPLARVGLLSPETNIIVRMVPTPLH